MASRSPLLAALMRLPPPAPVLMAGSHLLTRLGRKMAGRHPGMIARLGPEAGKRLLLDATDLPALILLQAEPLSLRLFPRRAAAPPSDAQITGNLAAFLAMLHGESDGDALFFSGELSISGDTSAVLALRNALDDAEIDLAAEFAALFRAPETVVRRLAVVAGPRLGLSLTRMEALP
ncbi:MAG: SCP2 sterol-binding domain-containing protein [Rubellimicrobium sp.]|nr:SCP2 sterol-binding domain-containing protein [Rubellimicrobium sp.]